MDLKNIYDIYLNYCKKCLKMQYDRVVSYRLSFPIYGYNLRLLSVMLNLKIVYPQKYGLRVSTQFPYKELDYELNFTLLVLRINLKRIIVWVYFNN